MALTDSVEEIVEKSNNPLLGKHEAWGRVKLGAVAKVQNGFAFKSELFTKEKRGMPIIRIRDVGSDNTDTYYTGEYDPEYVVRRGDLLIGMDGDFNSARWRGPDALLNQRVCRIIPTTDHYETRLLDFALPGYLKAINDVTSSVTVKHLSSRTVAEIPLPLPPLPEQRRIVSAIEMQLRRLDAAVARLHAAKAQLKRYKQAVLKAAVENTGVDTEQDLGALCELITSGSRGWAEYYAESGDTFIRAQNLKYDVLDLADIAYVRLPETVDGLRTQGRNQDILITITGANVTKTALVTEELEGRAFVNQHIALVRLKDPSQAPFVFRWIISPAHGRGILEKLAYGAGKPGLNLSHIRDLRIPLPSPEDQAVVVERLGAIDLGNDELESTLDAQLAQSTRLRQAVLKRAFEGRLV